LHSVQCAANIVAARRPQLISQSVGPCFWQTGGLLLGITMPAFGHVIRPTNNPGPYEISEVAFDVPFAQLRRIATFLKECADRDEASEWRTDHLHITASVQEQLGFDVIVFDPKSAPPRPVTDK
jgi:hypothetical protein